MYRQYYISGESIQLGMSLFLNSGQLLSSGNLLSRTGMATQQETFKHDNFNRLTSVWKNNVFTDSIRYLSNGNIDYKLDVGCK